MTDQNRMAGGISVTLPLNVWQSVMDIIADRPYRQVAVLLAEMDRQIQKGADLGTIDLATGPTPGLESTGP